MILSYLRTVVLYLLLVAGVRLMGKRQIGQMEVPEFVVTMLMANLASVPIEDSGVPLLSGVVPILTVLGAELVLSGLCLRWVRLRRLVCGSPVILVDNGRILQKNLRLTRITLEELMGHLRDRGIPDISQVQYVILETGGTFSVFPYPEQLPATAAAAGIRVSPQSLPVTLVEDGRLCRENLARAGRDRSWIHETLQAYGTDIAGTWLLTVDGSGRVFWIGREETP